MKRLVATLAIFLLIPVLALGGECFKWIDQQGRVYYGDRPPANTPCEEVAPPSQVSDADRQRAEERIRADQKRANERMEEWLRKQEEKRRAASQRLMERREKCSAAQRELNWLQQSFGARIAIPDDAGNPHWVSNGERLLRIKVEALASAD